jgi:hypothetical protein
VNMRDDAAESPPSNGPKKKRHGTSRKVLFVYRSPDEPDSDDDDDYSDSDIHMAHMAGRYHKRKSCASIRKAHQ